VIPFLFLGIVFDAPGCKGQEYYLVPVSVCMEDYILHVAVLGSSSFSMARDQVRYPVLMSASA